jgi:hypothetical protein
MEKIKILEIVVDAYWANANGSDGNRHILLTEEEWNSHHEVFENNADRPVIRIEEAGYVDASDYANYLELAKRYAAANQKMLEDMKKLSDDYNEGKITEFERSMMMVACGTGNAEYTKADKDVKEWLIRYMPRYEKYHCFYY